MSTHLINIMASSNVAEVLALDTEAAEANTVALDKNTVSLKTNSVASKKVGTSRASVSKKTKGATDDTETLTQKVLRLTRSMLGLDKAQHTVGYNIMGLSIRVGQWFVPAMILMYSSILPVIAGLLAIGSAAGVAALGLVGVLGIGAAVMSHRFNKAGAGNYGGPRQPYGNSGGGSVFTMLLEPIWNALESPELADRVQFAVDFVQDLFSRLLPDSLTAFLTNVNPGAMQKIVSLFNDWLPKAAKGLAVWGSDLMNSIGPRSLKTINDFFKYLAAGVTNTAKWLNAGGWEQIDNVTTIIGDVISTFLDLGKSALPVFTTALNQVWPMPLKPLLTTTAEFFEKVSGNKDAMDSFATMMQIIISIAIGRKVLAVAYSVMSSSTTLIIMASAGLLAVFGIVGTILGTIVLGGFRIAIAVYDFFVMMGKVIVEGFRAAIDQITFGGLDGVVTPFKYTKEDMYDMLAGKGTEHGEWAKDFDAIVGATAGWTKNKIHIFFHPDEGSIKAAIDNVSEEQEAGETSTNVSWDYNGMIST